MVAMSGFGACFGQDAITNCFSRRQNFKLVGSNTRTGENRVGWSTISGVVFGSFFISTVYDWILFPQYEGYFWRRILQKRLYRSFLFHIRHGVLVWWISHIHHCWIKIPCQPHCKAEYSIGKRLPVFYASLYFQFCECGTAERRMHCRSVRAVGICIHWHSPVILSSDYGKRKCLSTQCICESARKVPSVTWIPFHKQLFDYIIYNYCKNSIDVNRFFCVLS